MPNAPHARERLFLGWDAPILDRAARHMLDALPGDGSTARALVVCPSARGGRMLLAQLATLAQERGVALLPPLIVTPGEISGALHPPSGAERAAGVVTRTRAWIDALRSMPLAELTPLVPRPPVRRDLHAWSGVARTLMDAHDELARDLLTFADVPDRAEARLPDFDDRERWTVAALVQARAMEWLSERGMHDPLDRERRAIVGGAPPQPHDVVLVAVPELGRAARAALDAPGVRCTALVHAHEAVADRFDELGCVRGGAWLESHVGIDDRCLVVADTPVEQAEEALRVLARASAEFGAHEVVVGVPDADIAPELVERSRWVGGPTMRDSAGLPLSRTEPYRLLRAVLEHARRRDFSTFAALIRQAPVDRLIEARAGDARWLVRIDEYQARHLRDRVTRLWPTPSGAQRAALIAATSVVREITAPLRGEARPIAQWAEVPLEVLRVAYAGARLGHAIARHREVLAACERITEAARDLASAAAARGEGPVRAARALELLLDVVAHDTIPREPLADAIDLVGWLELPLDPSPIVVVTGFSDRFVPGAPVTDPLLPEPVRAALGLATSETRAARDAFILAGLVESRRECVLIAGRRTAAGEPLAPSRLLALASERTVAQRVLRFVGGESDAARERLAPRRPPGRRDRFRVATMDPGLDIPDITQVRVTSFRDYIRSPYAFYLRHVLGLRDVDDAQREIDPLGLGLIVHTVVERFAGSPDRDSTSEEVVRSRMLDELDALVRRRFGDEPRPTIAIQLGIIRSRLSELARWQASRAASGWRIVHREWKSPPGAAVLELEDGSRMEITGTIDRIDVHESGRRVAILDYKTGASVTTPQQSHRRAGRWVDLQLPLYRRLVGPLGFEGEVTLGYVALFGKPEHILLEADWTSGDLADAEARAREIALCVRRREFWSAGRELRRQGSLAPLCDPAFAPQGDVAP